MASLSQASSGNRLPTLSRPARNAALVALVTMLAVALGILTRAPGQLAPFWPANAVLLGLMLRNPGLTARPCWIAAAGAYLAAELLAGLAPAAAAIMAAANLCGVMAGLLVFSQFPLLWARRLRRPASLLVLIFAAAVSAAVTSVLATATAAPFPLPGDVATNLASRFMREVMSQMAILPVILAAPIARTRPTGPSGPGASLLRALPALAVGASCLAAMVIGGPGAIIFPVPALLWCAMTYGVFTTSVLSFGFTVWAVLVARTPYVPIPGADSLPATMLSVQIALTLLSFAPVAIASVTARRDEQLERLRHLSAHDPLTGLLNHRAFRERATAHLERRKEPAALLMIDLDHFKSVNDRHGHAAGDEVLRAFSTIALRSLRKRDLLGRMGGEEFAVFLPDCRPVDARAVAERLRSRLAQARIPLADGGEVRVTASIGLVATLRPGAEVGPLLLAADKALYRAKTDGRNRVEEHPEG